MGKYCFYCGEPGHIRTNCPYLNNPNQSGRGGGGGGGRSYQGGGGGGGNRFQALSSSGAPARSQQQFGTHRPANANDVVCEDMTNEVPVWYLSCYGHERGNRNDLTGDVSFEEARLVQYQERLSGVPNFQMSSNFKGALVAKEREIQKLTKAHPKPSLGGAPIHEPNPWLDAITGRGATPFGQAQQHRHPFGASPATPPFGIGAGLGAAPKPPAFGPGAAPHPFGGQQAPFGGAPGAVPGAPAGFGGAPPFGAPPPPPAAPFGQAAAFGQPAPLAGAMPPAAPLFGQPQQPAAMPSPFPSAAPAAPTFGQPQQQQQPATLFGVPASPHGAAPTPPLGFGQGGGAFGASPSQPPGMFGAPSSPLSFGGAAPTFGSGAMGQQQQQQQSPVPTQPSPGPTQTPAPGPGAGGDPVAQYAAPVFKRGSIPDAPPPPQLCA